MKKEFPFFLFGIGVLAFSNISLCLSIFIPSAKGLFLVIAVVMSISSITLFLSHIFHQRKDKETITQTTHFKKDPES